jgi:hypothetical protein
MFILAFLDAFYKPMPIATKALSSLSPLRTTSSQQLPIRRLRRLLQREGLWSFDQQAVYAGEKEYAQSPLSLIQASEDQQHWQYMFLISLAHADSSINSLQVYTVSDKG